MNKMKREEGIGIGRGYKGICRENKEDGEGKDRDDFRYAGEIGLYDLSAGGLGDGATILNGSVLFFTSFSNQFIGFAFLYVRIEFFSCN